MTFMELANTFYVVGIICMSLMTLILIALILVAIAIKLKIDSIHRQVEAKFQPVKNFVKTAEYIAKQATDKFSR